MNDLTTNTLTDDITTSINYMNSISSGYYNTGLYYNPMEVPYNYCYNTITTSALSTKLEINSNELKINIKKTPIKFNFNL